MAALKKPVGAYLIGVAVVVAVWFIINTVIAESSDFDVLDVWYVLDVLMLIGLVLGLAYNYVNKREHKGGDGPVTRRYLEANVTFYLTAAVTILFLHNWIALLAQGADSLDGNHSGVDHLGRRGRAAAHLGRHRLPACLRGFPVLTRTGFDRTARWPSRRMTMPNDDLAAQLARLDAYRQIRQPHRYAWPSTRAISTTSWPSSSRTCRWGATSGAAPPCASGSSAPSPSSNRGRPRRDARAPRRPLVLRLDALTRPAAAAVGPPSTPTGRSGSCPTATPWPSTRATSTTSWPSSSRTCRWGATSGAARPDTALSGSSAPSPQFKRQHPLRRQPHHRPRRRGPRPRRRLLPFDEIERPGEWMVAWSMIPEYWDTYERRDGLWYFKRRDPPHALVRRRRMPHPPRRTASPSGGSVRLWRRTSS